ncbi:ABC transporter permease [Luteibacter sp.]|uniref:ABC transporter permease n=1 Tax=Luteibacter sp. TaxID=1886636 RepID=UPI002806684D|nr:ABC transporter permease [Luteibacter sp.]MDQ8050306.1 ABC transporter permease [Luteibacter sp.]
MGVSMFAYYLELAFRSLRRSRALTALMILAVALGIGASMTTLTVLHVLSGDPLPERSGSIYLPRMDPRDLSHAEDTKLPVQVTWIDGMRLLKDRRADRQALMVGGTVPVQSDDQAMDPFIEHARYTTADFFPMFAVPFRYGQPWSDAEDESRAHVAVIGADLNDRLFGGTNSVGRTIRANGADLRIIGVLDVWRPVPHFYDIYTGSFSGSEGVFVPLSTARALEMGRDGGISCWGEGSTAENEMERASCTWLQYWVQLDSAAHLEAYRRYLDGYAHEQAALGRFQRPQHPEVIGLLAFLEEQKVVPSDVRLQVWLALGFFVVCLVNTVGLMLAKFMRRAGEVGVRRALGASRRSVFAQLLTEAGLIGVAGGVGGLILAWAGLALVRRQPDAFARLAHLDLAMLVATLLLSVIATLIAGLLPAWRACSITPALQLKSQ